MLVAGPAALLVAKVHKIAERTTGTADRVSDKDALDLLRLLQATDTATLAARLVNLADHALSAEVTVEAVSQFAPRHGPERSVPRCRPMGPSQPRESAPSVSHSRSNRARRMLSE